MLFYVGNFYISRYENQYMFVTLVVGVFNEDQGKIVSDGTMEINTRQ